MIIQAQFATKQQISEPIAGQLIGDISLPLKRSEKSESVSMFVDAYRSGKALSWKKWTFNPVNKYQHSARTIIPKRNDKIRNDPVRCITGCPWSTRFLIIVMSKQLHNDIH